MRLTRLAGKLAVLGGTIHAGLYDLAITIEPRFPGARPLAFRPRPWIGIMVLVLLSLGVGASGWLAVEAVSFTTQRLQRQEDAQ